VRTARFTHERSPVQIVVTVPEKLQHLADLQVRNDALQPLIDKRTAETVDSAV
jgi:hypothetical protein